MHELEIPFHASQKHQFYIDGNFQFTSSQTIASAIQPQLLGTLFSSKEQ
jgi:hypothetical protein